MKNSHQIIIVVGFLFSSCSGQSNSSSTQNTKYSPEIITIKVGEAPGSVEIADINNDRHLDLIVGNENDSSVTVLLGEIDTRFQIAKGSPFFAGHGVNDIAIGDFNNDGNLDLALANTDRKYLTVLSGTGQGKFSPFPKSPFPVDVKPHVHGIAIGDFNRDGKLDLATDSWGNDQIEILFGDKSNEFRTPGTFFKVGRMPYQRLRTADVNLDGNDDIVTTNLEGGNVTILLGDGKGNFHEAKESPFPCGDAPFGLAIGDLNDDGMPDLAVINSPSSTGGLVAGVNGLTVLFGKGDGSFSVMKGSPFKSGKIPNRIAIGDVNGDGINDVVTSDNDSNKIYLFLMSKNDLILAQSTITVGNHPKGIAIADLNGDGKGDIVVCNQLDNEISVIIGR